MKITVEYKPDPWAESAARQRKFVFTREDGRQVHIFLDMEMPLSELPYHVKPVLKVLRHLD